MNNGGVFLIVIPALRFAAGIYMCWMNNTGLRRKNPPVLRTSPFAKGDSCHYSNIFGSALDFLISERYFFASFLCASTQAGTWVPTLALGSGMIWLSNSLKWWMTFSLFATCNLSSWSVMIRIHSLWWIICQATCTSLLFWASVRECESWTLKYNSALVSLLFTFWPPCHQLFAKWK